MSQANVRVHFGPGDVVNINVDDQHLSRLTLAETQQMIAQLLVFGGSEMRQQVKDWLDGKIQQVAEVIAPDERSEVPHE